MNTNTIVVLLIWLISSSSSSVSADCSDCNANTEFCDKFENACRPCKELCLNGKFEECTEKCELFVKNAIFGQETVLAEHDLQNIYILLGILVGISSLIFIMLTVIVVHQCCIKARDRRNKRQNEIMPLSEYTTSSSLPATNNGLAQTRLARSGTPSPHASSRLTNGISMPTMITQISEEDEDQHPTITTTTSSNSSSRRANTYKQNSVTSSVSYRKNPGFNRSPTRIPSEDKVPDHVSQSGYDNRAMTLSSPTSAVRDVSTPSTSVPNGGRPSEFPPIANGRPYTISHSQVV